jgi:hypothetical protein
VAHPVPENGDGDVEMKDESSKPKSKSATGNGNGNGIDKPKKGRVGALVDAEKKARRRSSLGGSISLPVPQIPGQLIPFPIYRERKAD